MTVRCEWPRTCDRAAEFRVTTYRAWNRPFERLLCGEHTNRICQIARDGLTAHPQITRIERSAFREESEPGKVNGAGHASCSLSSRVAEPETNQRPPG